eukprot:2183010-Ditylum_brightwellii.AAC.1
MQVAQLLILPLVFLPMLFTNTSNMTQCRNKCFGSSNLAQAKHKAACLPPPTNIKLIPIVEKAYPGDEEDSLEIIFPKSKHKHIINNHPTLDDHTDDEMASMTSSPDNE